MMVGMSDRALPYWRLSSFYFCYYAVIGAFTPYIAQWLHDRGVDALAISAMLALWYGTRTVAPALWSAWAVPSPHPLRWLRTGAVASGVLFAGFLVDGQVAWLFATMLCFSFFFNAIMPQFEALTLDTLGPRRADYSRIRVWGSIGFIAVTTAYGWILERQGTQWLPALMLPLFAATAVAAFANRAPAVAHAHDDPLPAGWGPILRRPGVATFIAVVMLTQIGFGPYYVFFTLHLSTQGHGTDVIGGLWALGVLAEILIFLFAPNLLRRFRVQHLLLACLLLTVVRWSATAAFGGQLWVLLPMQLLHALSFGAFHACCMQLVSVYFPGRLSGHGQALLYSLGSGLGGVIGSIAAGVAWKWGGGPAAFAFGALATAAAAAVALCLQVNETLPAPASQGPLPADA
jgi:PPP family 3-phenylpropionic acid transporter